LEAGEILLVVFTFSARAHQANKLKKAVKSMQAEKDAVLKKRS
jgi:hypothetical protein